MEDLVRANLVLARERIHARPLPEGPLARLWTLAAEGGQEVLRISPHRTVLRVVDEAAGEAWLLKLCHPRRGLARARRLLTPPAAVREARLAAAMGFGPVRAAQVDPDLGLLARPWIEARPAPEDGAAWGRALAALHRVGWSDPDLDPDDLVWPVGGGEAVPVDLGHARRSRGGTPPLTARADLVRLLAGWGRTVRVHRAPALLSAYAEQRDDPWSGRLAHAAATLLAEAAAERARVFWNRSKRALRECSDFRATATGHARRGREPSAGAEGEQRVLKAGARSRVTRLGDVVRKDYARAGVSAALRSRLGLGPARRAWRALHRLELDGPPAAIGLAWEGGSHETLHCVAVDGREPSAADLPVLASWLARLHESGLGLRDAKPANFLMVDGAAVLVDPDGLNRRPRPARDLARLLAEVEPGSRAQEDVVAAYHAAGGARLDARVLHSRAAQLRAVLARAG